jgi:hypothetical protein
MTKFQVGDKVKINAPPENWPACTEFTLMDAEGTVSLWVDWPEAMDPYSEFVYVKVDKASGKGKVNEGAYMLFHEHTLEKI